MKLPNKLSAENLAYTIDLSSWLDVDDTITSAAVVLQSGDVAPGVVTFTTTAVTFWLSGGTDGTDSALLLTAGTASGQTYADDLAITIGEPLPTSTTKRQLVEQMFTEVALNGWEFDLTADEKDTALTRLDALMWELKGRGLDLGYNFPTAIGSGDLDDFLGCPDQAFFGLAVLGALRLCPTMGKRISPESRAALHDAMKAVRNAANNGIQQMGFSRGTPLGSGNKPWSSRWPFVSVA